MTAALLPKPFFWALRVLFSPVAFPERLPWRQGQTDIAFAVHNGYNSIDLAECTLRTMMAGGPPWMSMMRDWRDVPVSGAPGEDALVRIPIWNDDTRNTHDAGSPALCRCILIDPTGFRPLSADIVLVPETRGTPAAPMPIGPDAPNT